MTPRPCAEEERILGQLVERGRLDDRTRAHLQACRSCQEVVRLVEAFRSEAVTAAASARIPNASQVWWRARVRARFDAAQAAERPISIVQSLTAAVVAGLAVSLFGGPVSVGAIRRAAEGLASGAGEGHWPALIALASVPSPIWGLALACGALAVLMPLVAVLAATRE